MCLNLIQIKMLWILLLLAQLISSQQTLDAFVKIIDNDMAGQQAVYRFTVQVSAGTSFIHTYLPMDVVLSPGPKPSICGIFQVSSVEPISTCTQDLNYNLISFEVDPEFDGFLVYDIGYIKNPPFSAFLFDFKIQTLQADEQILAESPAYMVYVQIFPNAITEQSLEVDSLKIAAKTTYLFTLKVTNTVPIDGYIQVTFPTTQIAVPEEDPATSISVDGGASWTQAQVLQISTQSITLSIQSAIPAGTSFKLKMKDINNPNTMAETESFRISTLTSLFRVIDEVSSGLTVDCNIAAAIRIDSISVEPKKVGSHSSLVIKLTLPTRYSEGGYLKITLPEQLSFDQLALQCFLLMGFNSDYGSCQLESAQEILLLAEISRNELTFMITGIINPPNTMKTDTFYVDAYDPFNQKIAASETATDYGFVPLPGTITATATRSVATVGQPTSFQLEFTTQNTVQTGEKVIVRIPTQHFPAPTAPQCNTKTQYDSQLAAGVPCEYQISDDWFQFLYEFNCDGNRRDKVCKGGTKHTFEVTGLKNKPWVVEGTQSIQITTMTSDEAFMIDQKLTGVYTLPKLEEGSFSDVELVKTSGIVMESTEFSFKVRSMNLIPVDGLLKLQLPNYAVQQRAEATKCVMIAPKTKTVNCQAKLYTGNSYIESISFDQVCSSGCAAQELIEIQVSGVLNPQSTRPIDNEFTFRSFNAFDQAIDKAVFTEAVGLEIEPAQIEATELVSPVPPQQIITGSLQEYTVSVTTRTGVYPKTGKLVITLPAEVSLSSQSTCSCQSASTLYELTCQPSSQQRQLTITHSGPQTFTGIPLLVTVSQVQNPPSTKESGYAQVHAFLKTNGAFYLTEHMTEAFRVQANTPNTLRSVSVQRSVAVVSQFTDLEVCFTPFNPLPQGAQVTLVTNPEQIIVTGMVSATDAYFLQKSSDSIVVRMLKAVNGLEEFCFSLSGQLQNPPTTQPPSISLAMHTHTEEGKEIDSKTTDIFATPFLSAGPFSEVDMALSSSTVGQPTELSVTVKLQSKILDRSWFYLRFPSSLFYSEPDASMGEQLYFRINSRDTEACTDVVRASDSLGTYVESMRMLVRDRFSSGAEVKIQVFGLRNKFNAGPMTAEITVQSMDEDLYGINSSQFGISDWTFEPTNTGTFLVTRSTLTVQQSTDILIDLTIETRLETSSLFKVYLPTFWFVEPSSPRVYINNMRATHSLSLTPESEYVLEFSSVTPFSDAEKISLKVSGFRNRYSTDTDPTKLLRIETLSPVGFSVDVLKMSGFSGELEPGVVSVSQVLLSNSEIGGLTVFTSVLQISGYIEAGAQLTYFQSHNTLIQDSSIRVLYDRKQQEVIESPPSNGFFRGFEWTVPEQLQTQFGVSVANLRNLQRKEPLFFDIDVEIRTPTGGLIFHGKTEFKGLDILTPVFFQLAELRRGSPLVTVKTSLEITFELQNIDVPKSTVLKVLIPKEEFDLSGETCLSSVPCSLALQQDSILLTLENICPFTCAAGQPVKVQVTRGLQNPATPIFTSAFATLELQSDTYPIATEREGIQLKPLLINPDFEPAVFSLRHSERVAGHATSLELGFKIPQVSESVPLTKLALLIPADTFIHDGQPVCLINLAQKVPCEVVRETFKIVGEPQFALQLQVSGLAKHVVEAGQEYTLTITGLSNSDRPSDFERTKEFSVILITEGDLILQTGTAKLENALALEVPAIDIKAFERTETSTGTEKVEYFLTLQTQNYVRIKSNFVLALPSEIALANQWQLECEDRSTRRNVGCKIEEFDGVVQLISIAQWCRYYKSDLCVPGDELRLKLVFNNPPRILTTGLKASLKLQTPDDEVTALSEDFLAEPALSGLGMVDPSMSRHVNVLGSRSEEITVFVRELKASVMTDTDLVLELPDNFVFGKQVNCRRIQKTESILGCNVDEVYPSLAIKRLTVFTFCSETLTCLNLHSFELKIGGITNPQTNQPTEGNAVISLWQEHLEIGFVQFPVDLPKMQPPTTISIETDVDQECRTFMICQLTIKLTPTSKLHSKDYILVKSPFTLLSSQCSVSSPFRCVIDSNAQLRLVALENFENKQVTIRVSQALMHGSTEPVTNFRAESYEIINGRSSQLELVLGGSVQVKPSLFRQLTSKRTNTQLNAPTELRLFLQSRNNAQPTSIQVSVPTAIALLDSRVRCFNGRDQKLPCQVIGQEIKIDRFGQWCGSSDQQCLIVLKDVVNPAAIILGPEPEIEVVLFKDQWEIHRQQVGTQPALEPTELEISELAFHPAGDLRTAATVDLSFKFSSNVRPQGKYFQVQFDPTRYSLQYSPLQRPSIQVSSRPAALIDLHIDENNMVELILFSLPEFEGSKPKVIISGFISPNYVKDDKHDKAMLTLSYFETGLYEISRKSIVTDVALSPSVIVPTSFYSSNPYLSELSDLFFSFNMRSQITKGIVILNLPESFKIQKGFSCFDLVTNIQVECWIPDPNTISIKIPEAPARPITGFSFKIGKIKHPDRERTDQIEVKVVNYLGLFASGELTIKTVQEALCDFDHQSCSKCTVDQECTSCQPGYVLDEGRCQVFCDEDKFEIGGRCYTCPAGCRQCQSQSACSVCPDDHVMVNGVCLSSCPLGFKQEGDSCEYDSQDRLIDCSPTAERREYQMEANQPNLDASLCEPAPKPVCEDGCAKCSIHAKYCEKCTWGSLQDGLCKSDCADGYFTFEKQCYKCSPVCNDCDGNANRCSSCREGLLFVEGYKTCAMECPTGTFPTRLSVDKPISICAQCHPSCNSCDGTVCTSCYRHFETGVDLFLTEGECVEKCPVGTEIDYTTHRCVVPSTTVLKWTLPLGLLALVFAFTIAKASSVKSDESNGLMVGSASLNLIDFINRVLLVSTLWTTFFAGCFVMIGFYTLAVSLTGIYESTMVDLQSRSKTQSFITAATGPYNTRWLLGNAFGKYPGQNETGLFTELCAYQTRLTWVYFLSSILIMILAAKSQVCFGIALNGAIFALSQIVLSWKIQRQRATRPAAEFGSVLEEKEDEKPLSACK